MDIHEISRYLSVPLTNPSSLMSKGLSQVMEFPQETGFEIEIVQSLTELWKAFRPD